MNVGKQINEASLSHTFSQTALLLAEIQKWEKYFYTVLSADFCSKHINNSPSAIWYLLLHHMNALSKAFSSTLFSPSPIKRNKTLKTNRTVKDIVINILCSTLEAAKLESFTVPIFLLISELSWATNQGIVLLIFMVMVMDSELGGIQSY